LTDYEELVHRIKEATLGRRQLSTAELAAMAEQYEALAAATCHRLDEAHALLARGERTQAVFLAENPPALLDVAAALDFEGVDAWEALLGENGLPAPQRVNAGRIRELDEAYAANEALEPLQKSYRRLVLKSGPLADRIAVLRRIYRIDRSNSAWAEDLRVLEIERFKEIDRVVRGRGDELSEEECNALMRDLEHDDLQVSPSDELVARVRAIRDRRKSERLQVRLDAAVEKLNDSYGAQDVGAVRKLLSDAEAIRSSAGVPLANDYRAAIEDVEAWLAEKDEEARKEAAFVKARHALAAELDQKKSGKEIESKLRVLESFDRDVPGGLLDRARTHLLALAAAEQRKRAVRRLMVGAGVAVVLLLVAWWGWSSVESGRRLELADRIKSAAQSFDFATGSQMIADTETGYPKYMQDSRVAEAVRQFRAGEKAERERTTRFAGLTRQIEEEKSLGKATGLFEELERNARTDDDRAVVAAVKRGIEDSNKAEEQKREEKAERLLFEAQSECARLQEMSGTDEMDTVIAAVQEKLTRVTQIQGLSQEYVGMARDLETRVASEKDRAKKSAGKRAALKQAREKLPNCAQYVRELTKWMESYPDVREFKEAEKWGGFAPVYDTCGQYQKALARRSRLAPRFAADLSVLEYGDGDVRGFIREAESVSDSPYRGVLALIQEREKFLDEASRDKNDAFKKLYEVLSHHLVQKLYEFQAEGVTYYTSPDAKVEGDSLSYRVDVYLDETLRLESKRFKAKPSPSLRATHGVLANEIKEDLKRAVASPKWAPVQPMLEKLLNSGKCNPWMQGLLIKRLAAADGSTFRSLALPEGLAKAIENLDTTKVSFWIPDNKDVQDRLEAIHKAVEMLRPEAKVHLARQTAYLSRALPAGLFRPLKYAGVVEEDAKGVLRVWGGEPMAEYWIVAGTLEGPVFRIVARQDGGQLKWDEKARPCVGQMLFTPVDGFDSDRMLRKCYGEQLPEKAPPPWPENTLRLNPSNEGVPQ
jgi:hypothetical protein